MFGFARDDAEDEAIDGVVLAVEECAFDFF